MSRLSRAVRRIRWGRLAAGASAVISSGALALAFPQYAPVIAAVGALLNLAVNPVHPKTPAPPKEPNAPVDPVLDPRRD